MALPEDQFQQFLQQVRGGQSSVDPQEGEASTTTTTPVDMSAPFEQLGAKERVQRIRAQKKEQASKRVEENLKKTMKKEATSGFLTPENRAILMGIDTSLLKRLEANTAKSGDLSRAIELTKPKEPTVMGGVGEVGKTLVGGLTGAFGKDSIFGGERLGEEIGQAIWNLKEGDFQDLKEDADIIPALADLGVVALDLVTLGKGKALTEAMKQGGKEALEKGGKAGFKKWLQGAVGKITKGEFAKHVGIGAGFGGLSTIADEGSVADVVKNTLIGAGLGTIPGLADRIINKSINPEDIKKLASKAGLSEADARQISGKKDLFNEYFDVVQKRLKDVNVLSPVGHATVKFKKDIIEQAATKEKELGRKVGDIKKNLEGKSLNRAEVQELNNQFDNFLDDAGLERVIEDGTAKVVQKAGEVATLDPSELQGIEGVMKQLSDAPTMKNLDRVLQFIDNNASLKQDKSGVIRNMDAFDRLAVKLRKNLSDFRRLRMDDEDQLVFDQYSTLRNVLDDKRRPIYKTDAEARFSDAITGPDPLTALKRIASERDAVALPVMKSIEKQLGIDLTEYVADNMAMANTVQKIFGTEEMGPLLQQQMTKAAQAAPMALATKGGSLIAPIVDSLGKIFRGSQEANLKKIIGGPAYKEMSQNLEIFKNAKPDSEKYAAARQKVQSRIDEIEAKIKSAEADILDAQVRSDLQNQLSKLRLALPAPSGPDVGIRTFVTSSGAPIKLQSSTDAMRQGLQGGKGLPRPDKADFAHESKYQESIYEYLESIGAGSKADLKKEFNRSAETDLERFLTKKEAEISDSVFSESALPQVEAYDINAQEYVDDVTKGGVLKFVRKYSGGEFKGKTNAEARDFLEKKDESFFMNNGLAIEEASRNTDISSTSDIFEFIKAKLIN